jgi:hypothetical protein
MKKTVLIILFGFTVFIGVNSQNVDDALRYSQLFYNGTARFNSMGGAFTALGGDLSSLSLNPAGIGVYRSLEITITPQLIYNNVKSLFNNSHASDFRYDYNLSQIGIVANVITNNNSTGLINLNVGYSFMKTNNFNENITINGISDRSSMADYWVSLANGNSKKNLDFLAPNNNFIDLARRAVMAYLIDTLPGSSTLYGTIWSRYGDSTNSTYGQTMRRMITDEGYTGEHSLTIGGNLNNKVYFGATLGISSLSYKGHYQHIESDDQNLIYDFESLTYTDELEASGTGYSLALGTIVKPVEFLRLGFSFHSPTIYRIHEYYQDIVSSKWEFYDSENNNSYVYPSAPMRYSYTLTTPYRIEAGVAFQLKKLAIFSADYELVDYRTARFSKASDNYDYNAPDGENPSINQSIKNILKTTSNLRLGAEFRINNIYLRGGYAYYGKTFKPGEINENLNYNSISFGVGFRQQNFFFDLAFTSMSNSQKYLMYYDPGYLQATSLSTTKNSFTATLGYKF